MIFNSVTFLFFFIVVLTLYWLLPRRARLWLLLLSSLTFYGFWRVEFLPVMLFSAATDYVVGLRLERETKSSRRKALVALSLTVNLGLLLYFKYLFFFADNISLIANWIGLEWTAPTWQIILPLGISFYTFQTISYTIDVYRRVIKPERDPVLYTTYVTFFPQLVAGPVLRAGEVIHQLTERPPMRLDDLAVGCRRILIGLFLKVALADNISPLVDSGWATPSHLLSALDVWTLAFLFGFQIYFDFSAYSHIAIGCARMMGLRFPENFNFPYLAHSPRDFWKRWHISLSSWIRDYLYLPLSGARFGERSTGGIEEAKGTYSRNRALFLTWGIMGLWHGANWTFVLWGLYHALWIFLYRQISPRISSVSKTWRIGIGWICCLPVAMLGWIPFRSENVSDTLTMYSKVFDPSAYGAMGLRENLYVITAFLTLFCIFAFIINTYLLPWLRRQTVLWPVVVGIIMGGVLATDFIFLRPIAQFIYFQF